MTTFVLALVSFSLYPSLSTIPSNLIGRHLFKVNSKENVGERSFNVLILLGRKSMECFLFVH